MTQLAVEGYSLRMTQEPTPLLTTKEAASILKVSPGTLRRWVSEGRIQAIKMTARCMRFDRAELARAMEGRDAA